MNFTSSGETRSTQSDADLRQLTQERAPILQQLSEGVIIADPEGRLVFVNEAAERLHGTKQLDVAPDGYSETYSLFTMDGQPYPFEELPLARAVLKGETVEDAHWRIRRPDGSELVVIGSARPLLIDGRQAGSILTLRDDSARFEADRQLRESERHHRSLISASNQVLYRHNADWTEMRQLDGGGFLADTVAPDPNWFNTYIHVDDQPQVWARIQEAIRTKSPFEMEHRVIREDGSFGWAWSRSIPILDDQGDIVEWFGAAGDVTDRHDAQTAMRESEERFRNMADHAPVMMWVTDAAGQCTYLNKAWYDFTGQTPAEAEGLGWLDAVHPDDRGWSGETFVAANAAQTSFRLEYRVRQSGGTYRWAIDAASPRFGRDGEFAGYIGSVIDIDERKRIESRQVAQNKVLELALESQSLEKSLDALVRVIEEESDGEVLGSILLLDEQQCLRHGAAPSLPAAYNEAIDGLKIGPSVGSCGSAAYGGKPIYVEDIATDPLWVDFKDLALAHGLRACWSIPILTGQGEVLGTFAMYHREPRKPRDEDLGLVDYITRTATLIIERSRSAEKLRKRSEEFYTLADNIPTLAWMAYADGSIFWYNHRWYDYTGTTADSQTGWGWESVHDPDVLPAVVERWTHSISTGQPFEMTFPLKGADGLFRPFLTRIVPIRDENGVLVRWFGTNTDITAQREAEDALKRLNETLETRVEEEVGRRAEAEEALRQSQKMETLGQLTGGIAHDFNNLLQVITGNLDIISRNLTEDSPRLRRSIENAAKGADRAAVLTQRLLAFSRRQPLAPKVIDANKLVLGMSEMLYRSLGETIELKTVLASGLWRVEVDPNQLENAILNLAVNSRDAMARGGKMTVETANAHLDRNYTDQHSAIAPGQYVLICVSDTGSGMDPETAERAFDPFFTTKEVGKGTGLGLSMVYGFVKQSGGHLKIYSEADEGTTIKIYLPRHHGSEDEREEDSRSSLTPEGSQSETVLVCEDDDDVRAYSVDTLRELGYRVLEAADGEETLRLIEEGEQVDLLFSDVVLPGGMTGAVVARRAQALRPGLKILFTTGYARNAIVHHGRLDPGVELLSKPFSHIDLATRVRELLDS